jgi:hypothetical protein
MDKAAKKMASNVFFIQDRAEVLSAQILKALTPTGAITVMAHASARKTLTMMPMSYKRFIWRPSHPGRGSYSLLVKAFTWKPTSTISGWAMHHAAYHWMDSPPNPL